MMAPLQPQRTGKPRLRTLIFVGLAGLVIGAIQPYGIDDLLILGRLLAAQPAYLLLVILGMALMLTFGLPGSLGLWLIAPFQPPVIATGLLLLGSVGGAFGAYLFSARFRTSVEPTGFARHVFALLSRHGGVPTQMALRILPGFPHSVINFSAGVLGLPLSRFLIAAAIGLAIKYWVYALALYEVVGLVEEDRALGWSAGAPLLALAALVLAGAWARNRINRD